MKINLKDWQRQSSDKDSTIMRNTNGHELRIVHSALSPKFRAMLAALPMHKDEDEKEPADEDIDPRQASPDVGQYAKGGKAKKNLRQMFATGGGPAASESSSDSPDQIAADAAAQQPAAAPTSPVNITINPSGGSSDNSQQPQAPSGDKSLNAVQQQLNGMQGNAAPAQQPQVAAAEAPQTAEPQFPALPQITPMQAQKQANIQDLMGQSQAFRQDLQNGHITPKTYGELADKSTFGRIGTMFGLLAGGIGAGLTHQSNALLDMMTNEINQDLEAQKASKTNAQNLYNLTTQRVLSEANANQTNVDTQAKSYALAKMDYNQLMLHHLTQQVQNTPPGPQKQAQQQALGFLSQAVNNENYQLSDRVATMNMLSQAFNSNTGGGNGQGDPEQQFKDQNASYRLMGHPEMADFREQRHIPNVPSVAGQMAEHPVPEKDRDLVTDQNILDQKGKDLLNYIDQHKGLNLNRWNPQDRAIAEQKVEEMKNFYNNSIHGGALTNGRLDWYDQQFAKNPLDILPQLLGSTAKFKEVINSNALRRDEKLRELGFTPKNSQQSQQSSSGGLTEGQTGTYKGRPVVVRNGKWVLSQ